MSPALPTCGRGFLFGRVLCAWACEPLPRRQSCALPHAGWSPAGLQIISVETRDAPVFAFQETAAQATDHFARIIVVGSLLLGLIIAIQGAAILAWS